MIKGTRLRWAGHADRFGKDSNTFKISIGTSTGKMLGRIRCKLGTMLELKKQASIQLIDIAKNREYLSAPVKSGIEPRVPKAMELVT